MHFCVSDHVSEWLSQIVLDKVHLRQEIEACRPPGGDPRARKRDCELGNGFTRATSQLVKKDSGLIQTDDERSAKVAKNTRTRPSAGFLSKLYRPGALLFSSPCAGVFSCLNKAQANVAAQSRHAQCAGECGSEAPAYPPRSRETPSPNSWNSCLNGGSKHCTRRKGYRQYWSASI